jgi:hypothetical protein
VKVPTDPGLAAVYVSPKKSGGISGWPVPVRVTDMPEIAEQEPNNEPAKANKLAVPGGASGRFEKSGDVDHFAITCKKGTKYAASAMTYEINSPCEVLIRVLDDKGKEVARSNPAQPNTKVEFTAAADGDYVIACEQLNYLSGPDEIYHLAVEPVIGDFNIVLNLDRCEAPDGGGTAILATVTRQNGYAGPVELSIDGGKELGGKVTLPAGQTFTLIPVLVKDGTKPGAYPFRVKGTATVGGSTVVNYGTLVDPVKATLGGMTNPPPEMLTECAIGVVDKPAFALKLKADPATIEKGKAGKILVEATREKGADGDIAIAPLFAPPNVTATPKPVAKGQTKGEIPVAVAANAAVGRSELVFRATTKIGGKDYAVIPAPAAIEVVDPKKEEPKKKDEPKKDDKKKDEKKKDKQ